MKSRRFMLAPEISEEHCNGSNKGTERARRMSLWVISRHSGMSASCPLYPRKRTCALVGTIELDEAQQNHGVAAQPSRSRLVCVFRRRYSDGVGAVRCHLSDIGGVDAVRHRSHSDDRDDHVSHCKSPAARWWIACLPNACSPLLRWRRLVPAPSCLHC